MEDKNIEMLMEFFNEMSDIRIVVMGGSRVNSTISPDKFQDYDVVFFTDNIQKYRDNPSFLSRFGEILLVTEPDAVGQLGELSFPEQDGYIFLVQYTNGVRIDMQFQALERLESYLQTEPLTKILGDKDGLVKREIVPSDKAYWIAVPTRENFDGTVKEFWWQMNNTLKAILREEFLLAQFYLDLTRNELLQLMTWRVAFEFGFDRNYGKKFNQVLALLPVADQQVILSSYDTSSKEKVIDSLIGLKKLAPSYTKVLCELLEINYGTYKDLPKVPGIFLRSKDEPLAEAFE